jgi:hypothetical protein
MNPADPLLVRLLATREQGPIRWYASEGFSRHPDFLPSPVLDLPGLRLGRAGSPPLVGDWECAPLEPMFLDERAPGFPRTLAFDKLAFRTGWGDDDQYLLFEGVGNQAVSHSHNDVNGIVRLNHLGRHWVVSNGYGRRVGVTNVAESFATRIRGPEDHNMLVLRREGQVVRDLPVCSALLQRGRQGPVLYATGALAEYGGVDWFRTLVVLAGRYVLVVDRVMVTQAGLESAHVEWNCLGEPRPRPNGFRLEQKGVFLDVTSASGWRAEQEVADRSACWKGVLDEGGYPYTAFPLRKLVYHMPPPETGRGYCLATLLSATRSGPDYELAQPEPGCVIIEGPHDRQGLRVEDGDMAILVEPGRCEVRFAASPSVSSEWEKWRADSGARRPH